ncbi:MAG TPA: hypothetical protein VNB06_08165 [Thermoanaerobaculia bacterium]|nr:hypothetical protein [Thermoanaerobaculia bacterium]
MNRSKLPLAAALTVAATLCWTVAMASPRNEMISGVVVTHEGDELVIETGEGRRTFLLAGDTYVPSNIMAGNMVLVTLSEQDSEQVERIMTVDEQVVVTDDLEAERAVIGIVTAVSPQQLLVKTTSGGQAFVINPEKLFPPVPQPDQRVAVTYRTLEVHPPQHMATGLIVLPDELQVTQSRALVTDEPASTRAQGDESATLTAETEALAQEAEAETAATRASVASSWPEATRSRDTSEEADRSRYGSESEARLPQTSSALPALLIVGALALSLGAAMRFVR